MKVSTRLSLKINTKKLIMWLGNLLLISLSILGLTSCRLQPDDSADVIDQTHLHKLRSVPNKVSPLSKYPYKRKKRLEEQTPPSLQKRVSISITEEVPLKEALIELARQTNLNLQLDPKVDRRIFFSVINQPLINVLKDLCEMSGLRYKLCDQSIRIEADNPYSVNYPLPFLNLVRSAENRISIATDVFTSIKDSKSSADNGSNSAIVGKGNNDFWSELEANLKIILGSQTNNPEEESNTSSFSVHRQGGLVSVFGTQRQHQLISEYLDNLRDAISTQVLIEAKVIEVSLKDQFKSGINWQKLTGGSLHGNINLGDLAQRGQFMDPTSAQTDMFSFGLQGTTFSVLLKAIEEFGVTRTLSSPRLTVMNNQTAILKIAQNQVYFRLNYDKQLNLAVNRENINVSSDIQTVPIGIVMSVQPSIDHNTGDIILSLRPTISRLTHSVSDPAVEIAFANAKSQSHVKPKPSLVPVVEVREIDSVLRLHSGEIAILGGLMEARSTNETAKVPIIGDIPIVGHIFTATARGDEIVELVILLQASIIENGHSLDPADQRLYEDYIHDPRPFPQNESTS